MILPLTLIFRLTDYWYRLSQGIRDGLIVAAALGAFGLVLRFGKKIVRAISRVFKPEPVPPNHQQEVKIEVTPTPSPLLPVQPEPTQTPRVSSTIPRPPAFGFVARRDQDGRDIVERLKEELSPDKDQLIVLWGAGGVGKTTLAAEATRALRHVFEGGVAWISTEGRPDFGLSTLLDEIASHLCRLDLRQLAMHNKDEQVHQALANASIPLIVLDNFETISTEEQDKCATWLAKRASCPALITSRDQANYARPIHILAMSMSEAREFLQKLIAQARHARAFNGLDHEQIIQTADRIPLVLQWVVKQIDSAKQPETVLDDLAHGKGDAAQQVFDRSFELVQLGDDGRATLLALSLFVPSASRAALADVAGFGNDSDRLNRAVQQLAELWLIETTAGNERLSVQGLTRQLAKARLARDEHADAYRRRFVTCFLSWVEAHAQQTAADYDALEVEKDSVLSAMDVAFDLKDWKSVMRMMRAIGFPGVLDIRGYWGEVIRKGEHAAAAFAGDKAAVAEFAGNTATIRKHRGEYDEARRAYQSALDAFRELDNNKNVAVALQQLATIARDQGDLDDARRLSNESIEISRKLSDWRGLGISLHNLAVIAKDEGDLDEARRLNIESIEISGKLGDWNGIANTLHQLAIIAISQGETSEARRLFNESLEINKKLGDQVGIASTSQALGILAKSQGELKEARQLYGESLEIAERLEDQNTIALACYNLALLEEEERNRIEALRLFRKALAIFDHLKSPYAEKVRRKMQKVEGKSS